MKIKSLAARGFSLVEVVLALGVAAFCLVAIFGLLPVGLNNNSASMEQTAVSGMMAAVIADLATIPKGTSSATPTSPRYKIPAPTIPVTSAKTVSFFLREDGSATDDPGKDANPSASPRYRVTVTYNPPAVPTSTYLAVPANVLITWPALADRSASAAPKNFSGFLEASTSLDRN